MNEILPTSGFTAPNSPVGTTRGKASRCAHSQHELWTGPRTSLPTPQDQNTVRNVPKKTATGNRCGNKFLHQLHRRFVLPPPIPDDQNTLQPEPKTKTLVGNRNTAATAEGHPVARSNDLLLNVLPPLPRLRAGQDTYVSCFSFVPLGTLYSGPTWGLRER